MKIIAKIYHFLGGIRFALILIASVALFVIAGTLIESYTQSHRYAANLTYGNPFFVLLLWGFFINILFSATNRWPFQVRHIPFLITHLGLLMILSGALLKNYLGVQGTMAVIEGSGSHEIFESDSYVVQLEKKGMPPQHYQLQRTLLGNFSPLIADGDESLHLVLADYAPHSVERLCSWVKHGHATIAGLAPLPLYEITEETDIEQLPHSKIPLQHGKEAWHYYSLKASDVSLAINTLLKKHVRMRFSDRISGNMLAEASLNEVMQKSLKIVDAQGNDVEAHVEHLLTTAPNGEIHSPSLKVLFRWESSAPLVLSIPLNGSQALFNLNASTPYLGEIPIAVDLICEPTFAIIEDENEDVSLATLDPHGYLWTILFTQGNLQEVYAYEDGYAGYSVRVQLPFINTPADRQYREDTVIANLKAHMRNALVADKALSPPLDFFQHSCKQQGADFVDTCFAFLMLWNQQNSWLFEVDSPLPQKLADVFDKMDWNALSWRDKKALIWASHFFKHLDKDLKQGKDILAILQERQWPMISTLHSIEDGSNEQNLDKTTQILTLLTQQMYALADAMTPPGGTSLFDTASAPQKANLFSAYLRAFTIHLSTITPVLSAEEMQALLTKEKPLSDTENHFVTLETSLIPSHQKLFPEKKLEDNMPSISLKAYKKGIFQITSLAYNRFGSGLKWPILNGEYLVRFQPKFLDIPYHVRLRSARQINYANSNQPFSFEGDIIITDRRNASSVEKTISMNNVHETWDGYRFYLANITPPTETAVKHIQLIVNHDPAKYWLTYPGACIMTLGIVLLFWMRPYKKKG